MKKIALVFGLVLFSASFLLAQDAEKAYKKAKNAYFAFQNATVPLESGSKLDDAGTAIEEVMGYTGSAANADYQAMRGQIYAAQCYLEQLGLSTKAASPYKPAKKAALTAYEAFTTALSATTPSRNATRSAIEGIIEVQPYLNFLGGNAAAGSDFGTALDAFKAVVASHDVLKANKKPSILDDAKRFNETISYLVTVAMQTNRLNDISGILKAQYDAKAPIAGVYSGLYQVAKDTDPAQALKYLEEGRERFPEDQSLLYAEINQYLANNQLDKLLDKLKLAISKDPKNPSLYLTLGSTYDKLAIKAAEKGDKAGVAANQTEAMSYYNQALDIDPKYFDALFSLGVVYYNEAAEYSKVMVELSNDYTSEGEKKYKASEIAMNASFEKALPYFEKAFAVEPKDPNVLGALKEIHAKLGNIPKSNEYKALLEALPKN
jgi:tetratricopeptide (TPR) repeat protein